MASDNAFARISQGPAIAARGLTRAPLSPAQRRLWCRLRLAEPPSAWSEVLAVRLEGKLHIPALEAALAETVTAQAGLRALVEDRDGEPWLTLGPVSRPILTRHDLTREAAPETAFAREAAEATRQAPDPYQGPLLRGELHFLGPDHHGLLLRAHPLAADRRALGLVLDGTARAYARRLGGTARKPAPPPYGYLDYAAWAAPRPEGSAGAVAACAAALADAPPLLALPRDRPRPPLWSGRGRSQAFAVAPGLARAVRHGGRSRFLPWLALWGLLLGRLSGQHDVVVACPVPERPPGAGQLAGRFDSLVLLRLDFRDNPPLSRYLETVRALVRRSLALGATPPEAVLRRLGHQPGLAQAPLAQAGFDLFLAGSRPPAMPGLTLTPVPVAPADTPWDVALGLEPAPDGGLAGQLRYAADLFRETTVARWADHFLTLARAAAARPEDRVLDLPLLTPAEERRLITVWSGGTVPTPPADLPLPDQLATVCRRRPTAVAVADAEGETTYAALDRWSAAIAAHLVRSGLAPGSRVGVALPRSRAWIAALWGVWRAGAAFVSLDPTSPPRRLELLARRAELHVLIAGRATALGLGPGPWTFFETPPPPIEPGEAADFQDRTIGPDDTAYVVFTSGSSGAPKGIRIGQAALAFHARAVRELFALRPDEAVLQFASPAFDVAMEEIWPTLTAGGRLVIGPAAVRRSLPALTAWCRDHDVAVANLPARVFEAWAEYLTAQRLAVPPALRLLVTGSEAVHSRALVAWRALPGGHGRFLCGYGPSETTVTATFYDPDRDGPPTAPGPLPLGKPLPGLRAYVLDERRRPVPPGCVGSLHLAGPSVGQGYLHPAEDTAGGFQDDPFFPGTPLYRPGDRARLMPPAGDGPGLLLFEGRSDLQRKRRGFRIEPQEIEAALAAQNGVALAVVVPLPDERLAALVAPEPGARPAPEALGAALAETLPAHLLPDVIRVVERLPLLGSGKPDRLAAARLAAAEPEPAPEPGPPATATQHALAAIWSRVLGIAAIDREDNFFRLGGSAFQALRVATLASRAGLDLPPKDLFLTRSLAELALRAKPLPAG